MQFVSRLLPVTFIIALALLPGCSRSPLDSTHWTLVEMGEAGEMSPVIADTEIRLEFASIDGIVRGIAGCNTYSAPYTADAESLSIGDITSTRIYCDPPGVMEQEFRYLEALSQVTRFKIDGDELTLTGVVLILVFERNWW